MIVFMVILTPIVAQTTDVNESFLGLSPALYLPIAMVLSATLGFFGKRLGPVKGVLRSITKNFVTYDRVYAATKLILSQSRRLKPFAEWAAGILANIATSIPDNAPLTQVRDIVADQFADLPPAKAEKLLPIPKDLVVHKFARRMIAEKTLRSIHFGADSTIKED
jgi:hypothetical protein